MENFTTLKSSRQSTVMDELTDEVLTTIYSQRNTKKEIEKKIFQFLTEDAILERTADCYSYFDDFITPLVLTDKVNNVSFFLFCFIILVASEGLYYS